MIHLKKCYLIYLIWSQTVLSVVRLLAVAWPTFYRANLSSDCLCKLLIGQWFAGIALGYTVANEFAFIQKVF